MLSVRKRRCEYKERQINPKRGHYHFVHNLASLGETGSLEADGVVAVEKVMERVLGVKVGAFDGDGLLGDGLGLEEDVCVGGLGHRCSQIDELRL